jgi:cystathionine beta-lyase/cystathionine gamma-synthase
MSDAVSPLATTCVHAGAARADEAALTSPLVPPLYQASAYETPSLDIVARALDGEAGLYSYGRNANPTVAGWERAVAELEGAEAGVAAASGMGVVSGTLFGLLAPGQRLVSTLELYGSTKKLMDSYLASRGVAVQHLPAPVLLADGLPPETDLLYTETVSNPLLAVADLPALASLARAGGALLVVDNTFATPYHCRPLTLGADLVLHSASKYLGGHADLIAGVACGRAELVAKVHDTIVTLGAPLAPLEAWLALRGLRTLAVRMARQSENAAAVAEHLAERLANGEVEALWYPGLAEHPTHPAAVASLAHGYGAMVAFRLAGGRPAVARFLAALRLIRFAATLGDVSTTVSHPATTSHRGLAPAERQAAGIDDGVLRLSVGLEALDDILADLARGLAAAAGGSGALRSTGEEDGRQRG